MEFIVTEAEALLRLDLIISQKLDISRSAAAKLIEDGMVNLGNNPPKASLKPKAGDMISVTVPEAVLTEVLSEDIPLDVLFEDEDLIVINKPQGMVVHPAPGHSSQTLVNALLYHCRGSLSGINGEIRPGIVHRIDRDTSGLLVAAKNDHSHIFLSKQLEEHSMKREYQAIVAGKPKQDEGTINLPIGRHPKDRKKMSVIKGGREAITHYKVINRFQRFSHLTCRLETGRTHQIRVHLAHIGHPVWGDPVYGKEVKGLMGQALHAGVLGFVHPNGEYMEFSVNPPDYFRKLVEI